MTCYKSNCGSRFDNYLEVKNGLSVFNISYVSLFSGAKVRQEIYEAFENIYPILKGFKKQ